MKHFIMIPGTNCVRFLQSVLSFIIVARLLSLALVEPNPLHFRSFCLCMHLTKLQELVIYACERVMAFSQSSFVSSWLKYLCSWLFCYSFVLNWLIIVLVIIWILFKYECLLLLTCTCFYTWTCVFNSYFCCLILVFVSCLWFLVEFHTYLAELRKH